MAITFNTNLSALTSQRYLGVASDKTASSLAKLSSGSRVPTAKDDAAALAVGSKLRAEVAGLNTAANNASQAVSLLQIADGALSTIGDILVRQKALAVQSSSGQLSDTERSLLQQEFNNLTTEIERIAQVTNFNGTSLLNGGDVVGSFSEAKLGYLSGKGVTISSNTSETGADEVYRVQYDYTDAATDTGVLTVTNLTTGESQSIDIADAIQAKTAEAATDLTTNLTAGVTVDVNFDAIGITLTVDSNFDVNADFNATVSPAVTGAELGGSVTGTLLNANGVTGANFATLVGGADYDQNTGVLSIQVDSTTTANTVDFAATAGLEFSLDGVTFAASLSGVDVSTNDQVYVRAGGAGTAFAVLDVGSLTSTTTAATDGTIDINLDGLVRGQEVTTATKAFSFKVGTGVTANDDISFTLSAATTSALGISGQDISTAAGATTAITALNGAINTVASRRADIGANQSRLDFAAASIAVAIENTTAAQSGLLDVDVSAEITEFTSQQVLLQAGVSLLAQANQQPSLLLRLLQ